MTYAIEIPGLAEVVAQAKPGKRHNALQDTLIQYVPEWGDLRYTASRGDTWLQKRQVRRADGTLVAEDHEVWLASQLAMHDGSAVRTLRTLQQLNQRDGLHLTLCHLTRLYLTAARGSDPDQQVQIEVLLEHEVLDRKLGTDAWRPPHDLHDLVYACEHGASLADAEKVSVRADAYRFRRATDIALWLSAAEGLEAQKRDELRQRVYTVTSSSQNGSSVTTATFDELNPGWDRYPPGYRRLFDDWKRSSAGRASTLCDHWFLELSDYTDAKGNRTMMLIPQWTFAKPLAKVHARKGSDYEFYGALQKLDRRVGVPFAWYFYMLHGNRVESEAGERVIRAAEAGTIVLPEHDYRVLKDWQEKPYSF
ncbi:MAG: hypothetical protein ACREPQ_00520 [Rhodanobacter sp.]